MRPRIALVLLFLITTIPALAAVPTEPASGEQTEQPKPGANTSVASQANNQFAMKLFSQINERILGHLRETWAPIKLLDFQIAQTESNPQLLPIVAPNEVVVLISFELTIGDIRGMMNLCIPYNAIERIGGKLSANSWVAYGRKQSTPETIEQIRRKICTSLVELRVQLAETRITTSDLVGLRVGDVITTQQDVKTPLPMFVEGINKFRTHPGAFRGHKAVLIDQVNETTPGE